MYLNDTCNLGLFYKKKFVNLILSINGMSIRHDLLADEIKIIFIYTYIYLKIDFYYKCVYLNQINACL